MKTKLNEIDRERWRFTLYESMEGTWFGSFTYSPVSYTDASMLIRLTEEEQRQAKADRHFLIELSDKVRNDYQSYLPRAENNNDFDY